HSGTTTRCCVRVRPYPYIQCYTSVVTSFHTLCLRRPHSSTACERHACSSVTSEDTGISGRRVVFPTVSRRGFPPISTEKKFSCGCVAAVCPPPLRIEPRHRAPRLRGDGHIVSDQAHSFPRPSPSPSIPSWARASPTVPAAATARAGFPTGRVGVPTDRSGFD